MSASPMERAYGLLWSEDGGSANSNAARKILLHAIGTDGQSRGIQYARDNCPNPANAPVGVTGIWLLRIGDDVIVRAEIGDEWVTVITERHDGAFSHIVEPGGMISAYMAHLSRSLLPAHHGKHVHHDGKSKGKGGRK